MKNSLSIVIALLAGLVLGTWGAKSDLRQAKKAEKELQQQLDRRDQRPAGARAITSMLRVPEPNLARPTAPPVAPTNAPTAAVTSNTPAAQPSGRENIELAVEAWKTRTALARNNLIANLNASPVQTQLFDQTVDAMNKELGDKIRQWALYVKEQKSFSPETGVRVMNDLSSTVVKSYDELDRVLTTDWRDKAGQEFQLFDFINPEVALPLADIENFPALRTRPRPQP
jgi:hypothetical protein